VIPRHLRKHRAAKSPAVALERGRYNEARVLEVLQSGMPAWVKTAWPATEEEDRAGVDLWVRSDLGDIAVQVKSSKVTDPKKRHRYAERNIVVIVAHDQDTVEGLRGRLVGKLLIARLRLSTGRQGVKTA